MIITFIRQSDKFLFVCRRQLYRCAAAGTGGTFGHRTVIAEKPCVTELIGMCDRLLILKDGELAREFTHAGGMNENEIINVMI